MSTLLRSFTVAFFTLALALPALATVEDFNGVTPGTVVSGDLPQGGTANSAVFFTNVEVSFVSNNSGPNSAIIFDSANPTGGDLDLGSPNQTCPGGGPGVGSGGEFGQPGENCQALGHLVIIAEDLGDANMDDIVDDPDDEAGGGTLEFSFNPGIVAASVTLLDIDAETASATLSDGTLTITADATDLGDNSVQVLDLTGTGVFQTLEVVFSSSGSVAQLNFDFPISVEETSWGTLKAMYRR